MLQGELWRTVRHVGLCVIWPVLCILETLVCLLQPGTGHMRVHVAMPCTGKATGANLPLVHDQLKALATDGAGGQVCSSLQHALCAAGIADMQPATCVAQKGSVSHARKGLGPGAGVFAACVLAAIRPKCGQDSAAADTLEAHGTDQSLALLQASEIARLEDI